MPNNYEVWAFSGGDIRIVKLREQNSKACDTVIDSYVSKIAIYDDYILVKREDVKERSGGFMKLENPRYYMIDSQTDEVIGPLQKEEFDMRLKQLQIKDYRWIATRWIKR